MKPALHLCVVTFSTSVLATDISDVSVPVMKTPYGVLKVVEENDSGGTKRVVFKGKPILRECCAIGFYGQLRLPDGIAVLVGVNPGGSATPYNDDYYVILKSTAEPVVLPETNFRSRYRCKWKAPESLVGSCVSTP
jgi:hypothetical protein